MPRPDPAPPGAAQEATTVLPHLYFSVKSLWTRIYRPLYCFDDPGAHGQFFPSSLLSAHAPRTLPWTELGFRDAASGDRLVPSPKPCRKARDRTEGVPACFGCSWHAPTARGSIIPNASSQALQGLAPWVRYTRAELGRERCAPRGRKAAQTSPRPGRRKPSGGRGRMQEPQLPPSKPQPSGGVLGTYPAWRAAPGRPQMQGRGTFAVTPGVIQVDSPLAPALETAPSKPWQGQNLNWFRLSRLCWVPGGRQRRALWKGSESSTHYPRGY